ncbi:MAG: site-specific integrase [Thermoplasmata archaeon]|nr:site-specific integrase [Thermoplasmata archaeon]
MEAPAQGGCLAHPESVPHKHRTAPHSPGCPALHPRRPLAVLAELRLQSGRTTAEPPPRRVRWLSEDQVRELVEVTRKDRLLRLVLLSGLGQGLRRVEWLRLRIGDLDLPGHRLLVRGKGRGQPKQVWMTMHPALPSVFQDYLAWRERKVARYRRNFPLTPVPEELFIHRRGETLVPYGEGGANAWMSILERRLAGRGVAVKLSTHMLRRTGATLLERTLLQSPEGARDGVYRTVQGFLRHESIATTMRYLEADPRRQAAAMEAFANALPWMNSALERRERVSSNTSGKTPPARRRVIW